MPFSFCLQSFPASESFPLSQLLASGGQSIGASTSATVLPMNTVSDFTFHTRHSHSWVSFLLWPSHFILTGAISNCPPLFPSNILDTFWPGGLSSSIISFCFFILSLGFSRWEYWSGLSFPPPVDHILSELFMMTYPCWLALHGMAHSSFELHKPLGHNKAVIHEGEAHQ